MAWIQTPNGMWRDTGADDYDPAAYKTDAQYQQWLAQQPGNNFYLSNPTVSESGMIGETEYRNLANRGGNASTAAPTSGQVYDSGQFNDANSQFWQDRYDPATTSWRQVVQENPDGYVLRNLAAAGYFNRFKDFDAAANEQLGSYIADKQRMASDSKHFGDRGMLSIATAIGGGMLGAANAGAGAASAESASAGGSGAGSAGTSAGAGSSAIGAGDMFGSGAVFESGAAGLGTGAGTAAGGGLVNGVMVDGAVSGGGLNSTLAAGGATSGLAANTGTGVATGGGGSAVAADTLGSGAAGILSNPSVIGGLGGAALGALSSGGSKQGTIQTEEGIPDWLMPYVKPQLDKYSTELQNYQTDPYGIMPSAMKEFQNTVSGMYLDPSTNKYLEDYFRLGSERIKGSLSPSFGHMQAFGQHSGYNEALSRGLGDYAVGLYGGAYEKERDRQNQMTAAAPGFLGQASQANFQPYSQYFQSVGSLGKSKETPYFTNPWSSILGGAMAGSQFGKAFG